MATEVRARPNQLMSAAGSRQPPVVALRGGRPGKNEQPRTVAGFTPSAIMSPARAGPCTQIRQGDTARSVARITLTGADLEVARMT